MKKFLLLTLLALFSIISAAQTSVTITSITSDTTWTKANSPYIIPKRITIEEGVTLTLEPGVVLKNSYQYYLQDIFLVKGTLIAQGTENDPIVFTDIKDVTYGPESVLNEVPKSRDWGGIEVQESSGSSSKFEYCLFRYGGDGISIDGSTPSINHCTFEMCLTGISTSESNPEINNCIFKQCYIPLGIEFTSNPIFSGNVFIDNSYNAIQIKGTYWPQNGTEFSIGKRNIAGFTNIPYVISYLDFNENITLTIEPGIILKTLDNASSFWTAGTIVAIGTESEPIIFTSASDDNYGGDTNNDVSETFPSAGIHRGIRVLVPSDGPTAKTEDTDQQKSAISPKNTPSTNTFEHCKFLYGSFGISAYERNISVSHCTFEKNEIGVLIEDLGSGTISNSTFTGNTEFDIKNLSGNDFNAQNNQWGAIINDLITNGSNPQDLPNLYDSFDDPTYGTIDYSNPTEITPEIYGIYPSTCNFDDISNDSIIITAYPVTPNSKVLLYNESNGFWSPDSVVYLDSLKLKISLSFSQAEQGIYDVLLINQEDTITSNYGFRLVSGITPFNQWMDFEELNEKVFASNVYLPTADKIYCMIKKTTHVGYQSTWKGRINIFSENKKVIGRSQYNGDDIILSLENTEEGLFQYEINSSLNQKWGGKIKFCLNPDSAQLDQWNSGDISRPYGHDWKYVIVPDNTDTLFLTSEGYGKWSTIDVYYEDIDSPTDHWKFDNYGAGFNLNAFIKKPQPGIYFIKYMDSAVLYEHGSYSSYAKDQARTYMLYAGIKQSEAVSGMPLSITSLSSYSVGQSAVTIGIEGTGFSENDTVLLEKNGTNYPAEVLSYDNNNIEAFFNLFDADTGNYNLVVKDLHNNTTAVSNRNVKVIKKDILVDEIDIQVLSRAKLRRGRWQTVVVEVTNKSLIDQIMIPLTINIPTTCQFKMPSIMNLDDVEILDSTISMSDVPIYTIENDVANMPLFLRYLKAGESYRFEFKIKSDNQDDFSININVEEPFMHLSNEVLKSAFASNSDCYSTCADEAMSLMIDIIKKVVGVDDIADCVAGIGGILTSLGYDYAKGRSLEKDADLLTAVRQYALSTGSTILNCLKAAGKSIPLAKGLSLAYDMMGYADHMIAIANCYESCLEDDEPEPDKKKKRKKKNVELPIEMTYSTTPEDKYGPIGASIAINDSISHHYVDTTQQQFEYKIDYWNKEDATAPAAIVYIRDTLDTDFDITTFSFTEVGFLKWKLELEGGQYFNVNIDCRPDIPYIVNVEGTVNPLSREAYWVYTTLAPETMALPEDPEAGFLPPIDSSGYQIGWAGFTINAKDSLPDGTIFTNQAHVNFDGVGKWGPAPKEGPYTNIFDFEPPVSAVTNNLPLICKIDSVEVSWSGSDSGSGIQSYTIYVNNGETTWPWLTVSDTTKAFFNGEMGKTYTFYSIATDRVGNIEFDKDMFEASVFFNSDTLTLKQSSLTLSSDTHTDSLQIFALHNYPWTASTGCDWVTINSANSGTGNGTIYFTVDANTEHMTRSCNITVGGNTFTLNQDCLVEITDISQTICEGEQVTIGDSVYYETGVFTTILTNQFGCDSIISLDLTVNRTDSLELIQDICEGEIFNFGNLSYTETGMYVTTLTNQFGCDSVVTLNLTVHSIDSVFITEIITTNETYSIGDSNYAESGVFITTLSNQFGCDSVITLNLTVNEADSVYIDEVICEGLQINVGDSTYTETGIFVTTLTNQFGSDSIVTLNLTVNPADSIFVTEVVCEGEQIDIGDSTYNETGLFVTTLTNQFGCDSVVTLDLTVNSNVTTNLRRTICEGETFSMAGIDYDESGTYTAVLQTKTSCDSIVTLKLKVIPNNSTTLNESICEGETFEMGGESYSISGNYQTTLANQNGCDSVVTLYLTVNQADTITLNDTILQGETYLFNGTEYSGSGTYIANLNNQIGCDSIVTLQLIVVDKPMPYVLNQMPDIQLYPGDSITVNLDLANVVFGAPENEILTFDYMFSSGIFPDWISSSFNDSILILDVKPMLVDTGCYFISIDATIPSGAYVSDTFQVCVLRNITGTMDYKLNNIEVSMYPNPTKGDVTLAFNQQLESDAELIVIDVTGKQVFRKTYHKPSEQIVFNLSREMNGIYIVMLEIEGKRIIKSLILSKE